MSELMIPKSMHDSAVEAARMFGRQEAEREAMTLVALIVEAAGGEVRLTRRAMVDDAPDVYVSDEFLDGGRTYRTKRLSAQPSEPGETVDVERLARAIATVDKEHRPEVITHWRYEHARLIAREYVHPSKEETVVEP